VLRSLGDAGFTFDDVHLANSGGVLSLSASHYSVVRPGIALYGYHPNRDAQQSSGLMPVMTLHTVIAGLQCIDEQTPVSYGRRWRARERTTIATMPIGYADGLMRALTNRLDVLIAGKRYPVVGTICMDECMVDLGSSPIVDRGASVVVIGRSGEVATTAWDLADSAGTIPYEICTNISARVPRRVADAADTSIFSLQTRIHSST
jgi:alanine racemase